MSEEMLRPAEVATQLGVAPNTLRVYSTRFASLLGPRAARPGAGSGGGSGHRLYTAQDVGVLRRAHGLLTEGLTYDQAVDRLRASLPSSEPGREGAHGAAPSPDVAAHLATLRQAVEAWRSLAEERARETAQLRARLEVAEAELLEERRRRLAAEEIVRLAAADPGADAERRQAQVSWLARLFADEREDENGAT